MTRTIERRVRAGLAGAMLVAAASGCGLLDVSDPTAIEDSELNNAAGGELLRGDALNKFYTHFGYQAFDTGMFTDEFSATMPASAPPNPYSFDRRNLFSGYNYDYYLWPEVRRATTTALAKLASYGDPAHAGEMLAIRGYATLVLADDFCPGFPVNELIDLEVILGEPVTTDQAFERALADFDTAAVYAADSARVLHFAAVGRGAALLSLGRFAEAAQAVANVPTDYHWDAQYIAGESSLNLNPLTLIRDSFTPSAEYVTVADHEGGNGLDFATAGDPRVALLSLGTTDDGVTPVYGPAKYPTQGTSVVVMGGIEARLIEAEAALATGSGSWLTILNALRTDEGMDEVTDPVAPAARVDLLFRERAFWLFATGRRLGDLRRLVRLYDREPETVFPTGAYHQGGVYGTATSFPFRAVDESPFNPNVTGCTGP